MKNIKFTFVMLFSLLMISCGFHLRGNQDLSAVLAEVSVQGVSQYSELGRELSRALVSAKVKVFAGAATILNVTEDNYSKRVLSLNNAGRVNQYELVYKISLSLVTVVHSKNKGKEQKPVFNKLMPDLNITIKREYLFDSNLVLAKEAEENRLKKDMLQAAMLQLIRRLKFSLKSKKIIKAQEVNGSYLKNK